MTDLVVLQNKYCNQNVAM